jgi:hypothetical protein
MPVIRKTAPHTSIILISDDNHAERYRLMSNFEYTPDLQNLRSSVADVMLDVEKAVSHHSAVFNKLAIGIS